jgi:hypothetical protein
MGKHAQDQMLFCSNELFVVLTALGGICEIDAHCLPVSALIFACMVELIDSRMQSVISIKP